MKMSIQIHRPPRHRYVFEYNTSTGNWDQVARLFDTDAEDGDLFGYSVGIDGDILIIGAPYQDYDDNGLNFKEDAGAVLYV